MTQSKKLSRRDAIKLLGAATGATLLANLPSKWSKPSLMSGVLPAHAQTSSAPVSFASVPNSPTCGGQPFGVNLSQQIIVVPVQFLVQLSPQFVGFPVAYQLNPQNVGANIPLQGNVLSGPAGLVTLNVVATIQDSPSLLRNRFTVPTASCDQTFNFIQAVLP